MSKHDNIKAAIVADIEEVKKSEKITRVVLGRLSRTILEYVPDSDDIAVVNRLIGVLTPMNRTASILYFQHFLPWEVEKDANGNFTRFGKKMSGERKLKKYEERLTEWLAEETNTIWTWADENIEVKKKDFQAKITNAINSGLKGDKKSDTPALNVAQVALAIVNSKVDFGELLTFMAKFETEPSNNNEEQSENETEDLDASEEETQAA